MATAAGLTPPKPATVDEPMLVALAARATEAIRLSNLLQCSLTLALGALAPLKLKQRKALQKLNATARHGLTGMYILIHDSDPPIAERAG